MVPLGSDQVVYLFSVPSRSRMGLEAYPHRKNSCRGTDCRIRYRVVFINAFKGKANALPYLTKENLWDSSQAVEAVDLAADNQEKCLRQLARAARKNAKFLSSRAATARSTAGNVSASKSKAAVKLLKP